MVRVTSSPAWNQGPAGRPSGAASRVLTATTATTTTATRRQVLTSAWQAALLATGLAPAGAARGQGADAPAATDAAATRPSTLGVDALVDALADALTDALRRQPLVLLGEVHDNAVQHAARAQALAAHLATGARPALLMEQFDTVQQDAIDAWRAAQPAAALPQAGDADADALIAAASASAGSAGAGSGWHWPHYRPVLVLALRHGLPLLAANVSRGQARLVIAQGLAAQGFDAAVPPPLLQAQADAVQQGHCGLLPPDLPPRMALAQVARDQRMATLLVAALQTSPQGVLLLAGNGHVRSDIGVPAWLPPALRTRCLAVGLVEEGDDGSVPFDLRLLTPRQRRPDPCAALQAAPSRLLTPARPEQPPQR